MPRRQLFHEFEGEGHRCQIKGCQLGRTASVHRKPRDFPEERLIVAEAEIKRLKAGFRALAEHNMLLEQIIRWMSPYYGATGGMLFAAVEKWRNCEKGLADYHEKYRPKAPADPQKPA